VQTGELLAMIIKSSSNTRYTIE